VALVEQEIERFFRLDVRRDAVHRAVFAQTSCEPSQPARDFAWANALHFAIDFVVGDADGFALRHFARINDAFTSRTGSVTLRLFNLSQSSLNELGSTPAAQSTAGAARRGSRSASRQTFPAPESR